MTRTFRTLGVAALALAAGAAQAHTGHATGSLFAGLAHPLGADHLLAMLAVGLWSAAALPAGRRWAGPAAFMAALLAGAAAGVAGLALPLVEHGIVLSVGLFAVLLAAPRALPVPAALALIAAAATLHGLAHGAEAPPTGSFSAYAGGFLLGTAALHGLGLAAGAGLRRLPATLARWSQGLLAGGLAAAGLALAASL